MTDWGKFVVVVIGCLAVLVLYTQSYFTVHFASLAVTVVIVVVTLWYVIAHVCGHDQQPVMDQAAMENILPSGRYILFAVSDEPTNKVRKSKHTTTTSLLVHSEGSTGRWTIRTDSHQVMYTRFDDNRFWVVDAISENLWEVLPKKSKTNALNVYVFAHRVEERTRYFYLPTKSVVV